MGVIYEGQSWLLFLLVTFGLGGGAAWVTGRSAAKSWRPWPTLLLSCVGLGVATRFIYYALFGQTFFTLHYYAVDTIILMVIGSIAYRVTLARQMVTQYGRLYERNGPFFWRARAGAAPVANESK
jgi:small-conductance mechanosensitive channel